MNDEELCYFVTVKSLKCNTQNKYANKTTTLHPCSDPRTWYYELESIKLHVEAYYMYNLTHARSVCMAMGVG